MNTDEHRWSHTRISHRDWPSDGASGVITNRFVFICVHLWFGSSSRRVRTQCGHALLTTMLAAACLLPLGAFAAMQARLDWLVQHHTRTALETFTVADSGLEHALADLTADLRFDRLLGGPDGRVGTGDDGEFPFLQAPPAVLSARTVPLRRARCHAGRGRAGDHLAWPWTVRCDARGRGDGGALGGAIRARGAGAGGARRRTGARRRVPRQRGRAERGRSRPASGGARQCRCGRGTRRAAAGRICRAAHRPRRQPERRRGGAAVAEAFADAAARRAEAQVLAGEARGALGEGLFVSPASLRLADVSGSGVLVANGTLEWSGVSSFSGIVVALGDVRIDLGSDVAIDGAMMVGRGGHRAVIARRRTHRLRRAHHRARRRRLRGPVAAARARHRLAGTTRCAMNARFPLRRSAIGRLTWRMPCAPA